MRLTREEAGVLAARLRFGVAFVRVQPSPQVPSRRLRRGRPRDARDVELLEVFRERARARSKRGRFW